MRRLGSYELERKWSDRSGVQTWQGREGHSGGAALVFVLPGTALLDTRPDLAVRHPALLPFDHSGVLSGQDNWEQLSERTAYLSTHLPPGAEPLRTLDRAGLLGLLAALAAVHRAGGVHGGIVPELLWQSGPANHVQVRLAGAGLPWSAPAPADPAQDLRDLAAALSGVAAAADLPAHWQETLQAASGPLAAQELLDRWQGEAGMPAPGSASASASTPRPSAAPPPSRRAGPVLWPWLLSLLLSGGLLAGAAWAGRYLQVPAAPQQPPACCELSYQVEGEEPAGAAAPVRVQVLAGPPGLTLTPEQTEGLAPGKLALPGPGEYRLKISAPGYGPQTVQVTVPRSGPVIIRLAAN